MTQPIDFDAARAPAPAARVAAASPAVAARAAVAADRLATTQNFGLTPAQRRRAEALTSLFENDTTELQYGYAEALGDGRGITAGRAGFTSGTHDMLVVVKAYTARVPNNPLAKYLPRLEEIDRHESQAASVRGLEGLEKAWAAAARDPRFRAVQDETVESMYFRPAMARADALGLHTALGRAIMYDTIIQHGNDADPDGLPALIARTNARMGGSPARGVDEARWLSAFLQVRRADLAHAYAEDTRDVWAESVTRVDALASILASGNTNLDGPFRLHAGGYNAEIR